MLILGLIFGALEVILPIVAVIAVIAIFWGLFKVVFRLGWNLFKGGLVLSGIVLRSVVGPFVVAALIVTLFLIIL
ncbi:MAG: hypothetical protein IJM50_02135 [Lachnospiraceae bacterium]|nr:hypothetical protein [Lachnospiraceae bacterium]